MLLPVILKSLAVTFGLAFVLATLIATYALCVISGRESRREEAEELRRYFRGENHLDAAE